MTPGKRSKFEKTESTSDTPASKHSDATMSRLRFHHKPGLVAYVTCGDPDLPMTREEADEYRCCIQAHHLAAIFLAAPTSTDQRLKKIVQACSGFVYAISRTGVTGAQDQLTGDARDLVRRIRKYTSLPVAVGFG